MDHSSGDWKAVREGRGGTEVRDPGNCQARIQNKGSLAEPLKGSSEISGEVIYLCIIFMEPCE